MYDWILLAFSCGLAIGLFVGRWTRKLDRKLDYERGFSDGVDSIWPAFLRISFAFELLHRAAQRGQQDTATGVGHSGQETVH